MDNQPYRILVGIDFSPDSAMALDEAVRLAKRVDGQLELLHVFPFPAPLSVGALVRAGAEQMGELYAAKQGLIGLRLQHVGDAVPARIAIRLGDPAWGILDAVRQLRPDLVVLGSHGRGALMRALMGSVSEAIVRRCSVPVLVVPSAKRVEALSAAAEERPAAIGPPAAVAYSCSRCGHIRGALESTEKCRQCGATPAHWDSAEIPVGPADAEAPAAGEAVLENEIAATPGNEPAGLFATSPPGTEGYDVNPELRVRY